MIDHYNPRRTHPVYNPPRTTMPFFPAAPLVHLLRGTCFAVIFAGMLRNPASRNASNLLLSWVINRPPLGSDLVHVVIVQDHTAALDNHNVDKISPRRLRTRSRSNRKGSLTRSSRVQIEKCRRSRSGRCPLFGSRWRWGFQELGLVHSGELQTGTPFDPALDSWSPFQYKTTGFGTTRLARDGLYRQLRLRRNGFRPRSVGSGFFPATTRSTTG